VKIDSIIILTIWVRRIRGVQSVHRFALWSGDSWIDYKRLRHIWVNMSCK